MRSRHNPKGIRKKQPPGFKPLRLCIQSHYIIDYKKFQPVFETISHICPKAKGPRRMPQTLKSNYKTSEGAVYTLAASS